MSNLRLAAFYPDLDDFPERRDLAAIRAYLRDRCRPRYTDCATKEILDWSREYGSVECCPMLDDCDRTIVEALLFDAPPVDWDREEDWVWEPTDFLDQIPALEIGDRPEDCGCDPCREEAARLETAGDSVLAGDKPEWLF